MNITTLTAAHALPYRALMLHAYTHDADAFTSTAEERAAEPEAWWARRVAHPEGLTMAWGAFDGDTLVGSVALEFSAKPKTRHKAHLIGMVVHPTHRGRGLARALIQEALAHCRQRDDITVVHLELTEGNTPAQRLYQQLGFQVYGVEPRALRTPGGYLSKVYMRLDLAGDATDAPAATPPTHA